MIKEIIKDNLLFNLKIYKYNLEIWNFTVAFLILQLIVILIYISYGRWKMVTNIMNLLFNHIENLCEKYLHSTSKITVSFFMMIFFYIGILNILSTMSIYAVNANPIFTFQFTFIIFAIFILYGLIKKQHHFFLDLIPKGTPMVMKPLLFIIEIISLIIKPISLSVRLILNIFVVMLNLIQHLINYI